MQHVHACKLLTKETVAHTMACALLARQLGLHVPAYKCLSQVSHLEVCMCSTDGGRFMGAEKVVACQTENKYIIIYHVVRLLSAIKSLHMHY